MSASSHRIPRELFSVRTLTRIRKKATRYLVFGMLGLREDLKDWTITLEFQYMASGCHTYISEHNPTTNEYLWARSITIAHGTFESRHQHARAHTHTRTNTRRHTRIRVYIRTYTRARAHAHTRMHTMQRNVTSTLSGVYVQCAVSLLQATHKRTCARAHARIHFKHMLSHTHLPAQTHTCMHTYGWLG